MASKIISRVVGTRGYSAALSPASVENVQFKSLPVEQPEVSKLPNGIVVASVENFSPISRLAVLVKAGPRYESGHNIGIAHCLRNCAGLSTKNSTIFGITRNIEHIGGNISATSSREHIIYRLECIRDHLDVGVKFLSNVASDQIFKPWEVSDFSSRMKLDLAIYKEHPEAVLMEIMHKAAFRGGLSNSLYSPDFMIGKHNSEMLQEYVKNQFTSENIVVVGQGVKHEYLEDYVQKLFNVGVGGKAVENSKFGGGEVRLEMPLPVTYAAVVAEGVGYNSNKELLSLAVLQHLLGTGSHIKYGSGTSFKLGQAAAKCTSGPFAVSTVNLNYADCGLFGFFVAGNPNEMTLLIRGIIDQMKESTRNIVEKDVSTAKKKLKSSLHIAQEIPSDVLDDMGIQALNGGRLQAISDVEKAIDGLTMQDINSVASRVMKGKPAMAAVGQLHSTPHLDELI